jgi:ATP-dependent helicase/nuclease subunit B
MQVEKVMKFVEKVSEYILGLHQDFTSVTIVLPSKRPILFFKKYFQQNVINGFLPKFITIEDLVSNFSGLSSIKGTELWIQSFFVYQKLVPEVQFSDFLKWIPTVLSDFNDVELFSNEPEKVLEFLISIEQIENWGIQFSELSTYETANKTIEFWKKLVPFYHELNQELIANNLATSSSIFKKSFENLVENKVQLDDFYYFIGFNAFSLQEKNIIKFLVEQNKAELFFDVDEYFLKNEKQEAGKFLREHKSWLSLYNKKLNFVENNFEKPKNIFQYPAVNTIMQGKFLSSILEEIPSEDYEKTAIILCDEKLLLPVIQSIPDYIKEINITMGFPIVGTSYAQFFLKVLKFRQKIETQKDNKGFYFYDVEEILKNPIFPADFVIEIDDLLQNYLAKNWIFISKSHVIESLNTSKTLQKLGFIFTDYENPQMLVENFTEFCIYLTNYKQDNNQIIEVVLRGMISVFKRFQVSIQDRELFSNFESIYLIFKQLIQQEKLSFLGEPLKGIQLMGLLESRLLDFKHLILLSVNEGILPLGRTENSFIPFDVKKKFGIHTFLENDAIYAYHFYRLFSKSENIHLIYDDAIDAERSRFILQLELESKYKIQTKQFSYQHLANINQELTIEKSEYILNRLKTWFDGKISASALSTYLYNPLQFYLRYILGLKEDETIEEELNAKTFGDLIHKTLEKLYKSHIDKILTVNDFQEIKSRYSEELHLSIQELNIQQTEIGINLLHIELAKKTIEKIITYDENLVKNNHQLIIKHLEHLFEIPFSINNLGTTTFKGFIDRIDVLDGNLRIIDYKSTGNSSYSLNSTKSKSVEEMTLSSSHKHHLQLGIYAYFALNYLNVSQVNCGIWGFNNASKGVTLLEIEKETQLNSTNLPILMNKISEVISEIMNPEVDFIEKEIFVH